MRLRESSLLATLKNVKRIRVWSDRTFRNRRRLVASFVRLTLTITPTLPPTLPLTPTLTPTLTHVNQIYIRYFKERGMCYKTDKILKKTLKKTTFEKNIEKKIKSTLQTNVTAGIRACNHLHDARKIAP